MSGQNPKLVPTWIAAPVSLFYWVFTAIMTAFFFIVGLVIMAPLSLIFTPKTRSLIQLVAVCWGKTLLFFNPFWQLKVSGREHIDPHAHYVIIANHLSMLDILVCLCGLGTNFKFLAKRELFQIPFIGWHMSLTGYIPLDRSSHASGKRASEVARRWIGKGASVLFYPEGTRSEDGEIKKFKMGAFKIAQQEQAKILPVVIDGTGQAVPKKSWCLKYMLPLILSIEKPVAAPQSPEDCGNTSHRVRDLMVARLAELRRG